MRKTSKLFAALLMVSAALSCSKEISNNTPEEKPVDEPTVKVSFAVSSEDTKTELIDGVDNKKHVSWKEGDKITIFCANGETTTSVAPEDGTEVVFEAEIPAGGVADEYYAVYPSSAATCQDGAFTVTVPDTQDGAFASGNVSVAKLYADGETTSQFCNVTSFVKVVINDAEYTKVVLTAVGGEKIAGTLPVTLDGDNKPVIGEVTEGTNVITLNVDQPGTYYIAVNPVVCTRGLAAQYYKGETKAGAYFLDRELPLGRSKISSLGTLEDRMSKFYVTVEGTGSKSGSNWKNAMSRTVFRDFVRTKDTDEAAMAAHAAMLDGATFYFAGGTYDLEEYTILGFSESLTDYVNITFDGSYNPANGAKDYTNRTIFTGNDDHRIFSIWRWTKATFKDCNFEHSKGNGSSEAAVKLSYANSYLIADNCIFDNNVNSGRGGGLAIANGKVELVDCNFTNNTASCGSAFTVDNKDCGESVTVNGGMISGNKTTDATYSGAICCFGGGPLTVEDVTFYSNTTENANGGAFQMIDKPVETTFTDCVFGSNSDTANKAKHGGAVAIKGGTATFTGCTFAYNSATGDGGAILANGSSNLTFNGCTLNNNTCVGLGGCFDIEGGARVTLGKNGSTASSITANSAPTGGAFYVKSGSKLTLNECTVNGNKATSKGGVIFATGSSTECNINGGTISGNSAPQGGVAYAETSGKVIVSKNGAAVATISNNTASTNGGAFCIFEGGEVTLNDCTVSANSATKEGGAVYVNGGSSKIYANNATFSANVCTGEEGGAICAWSSGKVYVNGGTFSGNKSKWGPAIELESSARAEVSGNTIFSQNVASGPGGAVFISSSSSATIDGASFTGNSAADNGGAIHVKNSSTLLLKNSSLSENHSIQGGAVYVNGTTNVAIEKTSFVANYSSSFGGAILANNGSFVATECIFKGNYSNGSTSSNYGGAISLGERTSSGTNGKITAKLNKCFFTGNHAYDGGAICMNDTGANMYMNACSFYKDYCTENAGGSTMYYNFGTSFHMNNCTVLDGTWNANASDSINSAWFYFNRACKFTISNCTFIGDLRKTDGGTSQTAGGLIRFKNGNNTGYSINNIIAPKKDGTYAAYIAGTFSCTSYYTKRAGNYGGSNWSSNSTDGYNALASAFGGLTENKNANGNYANNYYSWNGTMSGIPSGSMNNKAQLSEVKSRIQTSDADFYTWLNDIGALDKDQLGNTRGATTWPGAYDGSKK